MRSMYVWRLHLSDGDASLQAAVSRSLSITWRMSLQKLPQGQRSTTLRTEENHLPPSTAQLFQKATLDTITVRFDVGSGLTSGQCVRLQSASSSGANAFLGWSAEL